MYKVFINDLPLCIATPADAQQLSQEMLQLAYTDVHTFRTAIALLEENSGKISGICITGKFPKKMFAEFSSLFKIQEAAGGRVHNARNQVLLIFRRNRWDLPKGKIDKGETPRKAAIREVEEECGISQLRITRALPLTYHVFTQMKQNQRILKITHWFEMQCADTRKLVPQTEEDIEIAEWASPRRQKEILPLFYRSLLPVLYA
jgi:8-oxo-dGTP pyrophosphatase MutT (NUDIX family)